MQRLKKKIEKKYETFSLQQLKVDNFKKQYFIQISAKNL